MTTSPPISDQAVDERSIVLSLIELASAAFLALDDSEEREGDDGREYVINSRNFDAVSEALDTLDFLPDDKPGYTLAGPGRAEWALRGFLSAARTTGSAPVPNMMARCENRAFVTVGFKSPEECSAFIRAVNHAPPASPAASVPLAFESALTELVNKIDTGLDSGDLLIDARRASDALDAILTKGDLVANAYDYFRDSPGHYENSREFRIGWNACLDAIGAARAALLVASTGGDKS